MTLSLLNRFVVRCMATSLLLCVSLLADPTLSGAAAQASTVAGNAGAACSYDSPAATATLPTNSRVDATRGEHRTGGASRASTSLIGRGRAPKAGPQKGEGLVYRQTDLFCAQRLCLRQQCRGLWSFALRHRCFAYDPVPQRAPQCGSQRSQ